MSSGWKIHKFGGSSLADAACFRRVVKILLSLQGENLGVVVSAMGGMTDALLELCSYAEEGSDFQYRLERLQRRYQDTAAILLPEVALTAVMHDLEKDVAAIGMHLEGAAENGVHPVARDIICGYGELWSARLLAACLSATGDVEGDVCWIDSRQVITVSHTDLGPSVLWAASQKSWNKALVKEFYGIAVMTGFIATDQSGKQTTLGRNGSDFSGAIMAVLAGADQLDIWTDVDGVMSADPRQVPEAQVIESLSYSEAMELAYFGAKVIHPKTLQPAMKNDIAVVIRNSFDPEKPGSRIAVFDSPCGGIKGITAVSDIALVNIEGAGMIGVPGTAERIFATLKQAGVSVTLISQGSSEHSICLALASAEANNAKYAISEAFSEELASGQIQSIDVTPDQSIIAVVGDGMAGTPGIAARFFSNLGKAGINVRAIAQGSSERNISAVIDSSNVTRALRSVHSGFYLSAKTLSIGVIGTGVVGSTLLKQMEAEQKRLKSRFNIDLRIRAIAKSDRMVLAKTQVDLRNWKGKLDSKGQATDLAVFEGHVCADHLPHAVIIDCTADQHVADQYSGWLRRGIHIVTPNKKALSGSQASYEELNRSAIRGASHYLYETTVGASLPIIKTIRDLIDTGDRVHSIKGILSGTLAYLFNSYDGTKPFSEIVMQAKANGFTEPDPRDDLSGMDVARKLTIIARELGQEIQVGDFPVQNLVPEPLKKLEVEGFLCNLQKYDDEMLELYQETRSNNQTLRYIASLDLNGNASVGLEKVPADDALSNIQLTDNLVQFKSDRYAANPLVIQGPGAGPEVTAAGVFGDLLKLASLLGDN